MKFVFCYDISDEKRLGKIARRMEKYGIRVQYSKLIKTLIFIL